MTMATFERLRGNITVNNKQKELKGDKVTAVLCTIFLAWDYIPIKVIRQFNSTIDAYELTQILDWLEEEKWIIKLPIFSASKSKPVKLYKVNLKDEDDDVVRRIIGICQLLKSMSDNVDILFTKNNIKTTTKQHLEKLRREMPMSEYSRDLWENYFSEYYGVNMERLEMQLRNWLKKYDKKRF